MLENLTRTSPPERDAQLFGLLGSLLEQARAAVTNDKVVASECIDRAVQLLPVSQPGRSGSEHSAPVFATGGLAPWQIGQIKRYVEARLSNRIATSDLAHAVMLSTGHFTRAFKASFGMSPRDYVAQQRVATAKARMLETNLPLCEIALVSGLADQAHFCRVFRRATGASPAAWRRRALSIVASGEAVRGQPQHPVS